MAKIYIDGKEYDVSLDKNLLDASISVGEDIPYFCWHPALGSVGACRQCAVKVYKDENDTKGRIVMSCMEPVAEGKRISIDDPEVKAFRENIIESYMTNHPHDCPVCDEGGECHLQDMTQMSGHNYRRYKYKKRTYRNQYLGPFINHEMNRCIQCYRCVRFYRDYAGGKDLNAFGSHNHVFFGRSEDGVLENEFSGNLVEVCPTGVFTDKTLKKHYTRKWDLTMSPSICTHCSVGCNTIAAERYGSLRRIYSRYNGKVNGYFLCDRGRFGYEFVNSKKRIKSFFVKEQGAFKELSKPEAFESLVNVLRGKNVIGIGSPRASLEANFALRAFVGENNFFNGLNNAENQLQTLALNILKNGPARTPSLREMEEADAVFVLGEDVTNTAPMIALALRQAAKQEPKEIAKKAGIQEWHDAAVRQIVQGKKGPFYIASTTLTRLDDIATKTFVDTPDNIARLGFAVAAAINSALPKVEGLNDVENALAKEIASKLIGAKKPLIVSGTHSGSEAVLQAAANISWALTEVGRQAEISLTFPECNSLGITMMESKSLESAADTQVADTVIILENDIYRHLGKPSADHFLSKFKNIIVLDHTESATTEKATIVMPVGTFAESDGTFVNNEGRAQRFFQVFVPEVDILESWRRIKEIMDQTNFKYSSALNNLYDFTVATASAFPKFKGIENITPPPSFRLAGDKIPRETHRYSGRTAMKAHINVSEPKPAEDPDSPMSFTMEGYRGGKQIPSSLIPFFWSPGWNSQNSINKYTIEVGGPLHGGDPGLRLLEPSTTAIQYFKNAPKAFSAKAGEVFVVPVYHIFGSEEFGSLAPAIAERTPKAYVAVNEKTLKAFGIVENSEVRLDLNGDVLTLQTVIKNELPDGVAGVSAGFRGISTVKLPTFGKIK